MALAMEHSLFARRLCFTADIVLLLRIQPIPYWAGFVRVQLSLRIAADIGRQCSGGLTRLGLGFGYDLGLQRAAMRDKHACFAQALQLRLADAEFAEHRPVMFALESGRPDRRQFFRRKAPWPAWQAILAAAAVRNVLHGPPVIAPFGGRKLLDR